MILSNVEQEVRHEAAQLIKDIEQQAKEEADKKAREIITLGHSALRSRSCGGNNRLRRHAAERRDERPHYRP